jgi:hypothetical protein
MNTTNKQKPSLFVPLYYIEGAHEREGTFWLPAGYGYTKNKQQAGRFSLDDMKEHNLDGCKLWRVED